MRNSEHYITTTGSEPLATDDETTGHFLGPSLASSHGCWRWVSRFLSTAATRCFLSLHRPFFLALMPVAVVVGIALHSLLNGKLLYSTVVTIVTVVLMFGLLFLWLMG